MNSVQVYECLRLIMRGKLNVVFDVISSDKLENFIKVSEKKKYVFILIVNLDPSYLRGSHYIVVAKLSYEYEVYDSYAKNMHLYNKTWFAYLQSKNPVQNCISHQLDSSLLCGGFCLRYIHFRLRGLSISQTLNTFFSSKYKNEKIVNSFLKCKFGNILVRMQYFKSIKLAKCE